MDTTAKTNREYKNSVFALLFGAKERLIELYNAIFDTNYSPDTDILITTLTNVLYMEQINDLSFVIDGKIVVLIEHQSTINHNMPLRMLLYIARVYEKITEKRDLYLTTMRPVPRPEFVVLYNGLADVPEEQELRLSDMFVKCGDERDRIIDLDLTVKVYNINKGYNPKLARKSPTLDGYEIFTAKAREVEKTTKNRAEAIAAAIDYCIENNILKEFFETNSTEVRNMLLSEWDMNVALEVREEEGMAKGKAKGKMEGKIEVAKRLRTEGMDVNTVARLTDLTVDDILRL